MTFGHLALLLLFEPSVKTSLVGTLLHTPAQVVQHIFPA
jgi:hypothetical protein